MPAKIKSIVSSSVNSSKLKIVLQFTEVNVSIVLSLSSDIELYKENDNFSYRHTIIFISTSSVFKILISHVLKILLNFVNS